MLEPTLVKLQETSFDILVVDFDLFTCHLLDGLILVLSIAVQQHFFDIIKDPFQFVETNIV